MGTDDWLLIASDTSPFNFSAHNSSTHSPWLPGNEKMRHRIDSCSTGLGET